MLAHRSAFGESRKASVLQDLRDAGLEPKLEILAHALPSEDVAYRVESAAIDLLGLDDLVNEQRGHRCALGRMPLRELLVYYTARPQDITEPTLLIRINQLYRHGMEAHSLYEATRGIWKVGPRRSGTRLAMAVFQGVVREVYRIDTWHPAGTTQYVTRRNEELQVGGRWEFLGAVAPGREKYVDRSVAAYMKPGAQNPVAYVGC